MSNTLAEALYRIAAISLSGGAFALIYCLVLGAISKRDPVAFAPAVAMAFLALASFMFGRGLRGERRHDPTEAANYYSAALSYLLVSMAGYAFAKAMGPEFPQ